MLILAFGVALNSIFTLAYIFPHFEMYTFLEKFAMNGNPKFDILTDLTALFRIELEGGVSRPRFYSWYFGVLNVKFRHLLFSHISTPHPAITLTWFFTLFALPFYFFKFISIFTSAHKRAAILATACIVCSIGNLSTMTMYFHAGKPMSLFF